MVVALGVEPSQASNLLDTEFIRLPMHRTLRHRNGSPGTARTCDLSVNSRMLYH